MRYPARDRSPGVVAVYERAGTLEVDAGRMEVVDDVGDERVAIERRNLNLNP